MSNSPSGDDTFERMDCLGAVDVDVEVGREVVQRRPGHNNKQDQQPVDIDGGILVDTS